jgi:hypothetical protein
MGNGGRLIFEVASSLLSRAGGPLTHVNIIRVIIVLRLAGTIIARDSKTQIKSELMGGQGTVTVARHSESLVCVTFCW